MRYRLVYTNKSTKLYNDIVPAIIDLLNHVEMIIDMMIDNKINTQQLRNISMYIIAISELDTFFETVNMTISYDVVTNSLNYPIQSLGDNTYIYQMLNRLGTKLQKRVITEIQPHISAPMHESKP